MPFSSMHLDFCAAEKDPYKRGRREVIAAPRGHAKTTFKTLFKVIHAICYNYEPFIVVVSHSAGEAQNKVRDVLEELIHNPRLINVYGPLAPRQGQYNGVGKWGTREFVTLNGIKVMAKSRGQQMRGLKFGPNRPSLIICDDIESLDRIYNQEQRDKTLAWFQKDLLKIGQTDGTTNITVVGTCLHPESLLMTLLETPGWESRLYQAVINDSENPELWEEYKRIYTDLSNPKRVQAAWTFYRRNKKQMDEGVKVLWPEGDSYESLIRMQIDEGRASFHSEKQNEPYDPDRQIFDMDNARRFRFDIQNKKVVGFQWLNGSERYVPADHLEKVIAYHDPAFANDSKDTDYSAIVVVIKDKDGYLYCVDTSIKRIKPSQQIDEAMRLYKLWHFEKIYVESNGGQILYKNLYRERIERDFPHSRLMVSEVNNTQNKLERISTMEPLITNGHLLFAESLPQILITQLRLFPTGHDDGPDALHGAVEKLKRQMGSITVIQRGYVPY